MNIRTTSTYLLANENFLVLIHLWALAISNCGFKSFKSINNWVSRLTCKHALDGRQARD